MFPKKKKLHEITEWSWHELAFLFFFIAILDYKIIEILSNIARCHVHQKEPPRISLNDHRLILYGSTRGWESKTIRQQTDIRCLTLNARSRGTSLTRCTAFDASFVQGSRSNLPDSWRSYFITASSVYFLVISFNCWPKARLKRWFVTVTTRSFYC